MKNYITVIFGLKVKIDRKVILVAQVNQWWEDNLLLLQMRFQKPNKAQDKSKFPKAIN